MEEEKEVLGAVVAGSLWRWESVGDDEEEMKRTRKKPTRK